MYRALKTELLKTCAAKCENQFWVDKAEATDKKMRKECLQCVNDILKT